MIRKIALGVSALALTVGGLAVTAGPAFAGKPSLSGHLTCNTAGSTTFKPSLVLTIPDKKPGKPGKDHKTKITTHTVLSGCTGAETNGLIPPTGGTTDTKTGNPSRLCTNQGNVPPGKTKTTLTGGSGGKFKEAGGSSTSFVDNGTPNNHGDDIALPTTQAALISLLGTNGGDQLYILGVGGHSTGKSYSGKPLSSVSHSPGLLAKFNACVSTAGLGSISTTGTTTIG